MFSDESRIGCGSTMVEEESDVEQVKGAWNLLLNQKQALPGGGDLE